MAVVRRLSVELVAKSDKFSRDMKSAGAKLDAFGQKATAVGRTMTRRVTLPLLAAAGAMVKVGVTFDEEMTKVITLVGVADEQVNKWREDILKLGPAVGAGPTELARALFVVTSAGERGADALGIVEEAAKASAIGLGDTATTARAVTAAMQAYSEQGLTAARATQILVATVREGNLRAEDLAGSLGRVLGIASQVGSTFEDVGAFIATFTRLGVSAEESATSLRQIFQSMIKPEKNVAKALESVNLSSAKLREELGKQGLVGVLGLIIDSFDGNIDKIGQVITNIRALSGVLGTAGAQGKAYIKISDNITNSLTIVEDSFRRVQETAAFKWDVFRAEAEALSIELGSKLIPAFERLLGALSKGIESFSQLAPEMQNNIIIFAGLLAVVGPLSLAIGALVKGFVLLKTAFIVVKADLIAFSGAMSAGTAVINPYVFAIAALAVGLLQIAKAARQAKRDIEAMHDAQRDTVQSAIELAKLWNEKVTTLKLFDPELYAEWGTRVDELMSQGVDMYRAFSNVWREMGLNAKTAGEETDRVALKWVAWEGYVDSVNALMRDTGNITFPGLEGSLENIIHYGGMIEVDIPPAVDVVKGSVEKLEDAILSLSSTMVTSMQNSAVTFHNLGKAIIKTLRNIVLSNYAKKFLGLMIGFAGGTSGGFLKGVSKILGFSGGGTAGFGGSLAGPSDTIPAMLTPGERVIPVGQPASLAMPVGGGGGTINVTVNSVFGSRGERESIARELKRVMEGL